MKVIDAKRAILIVGLFVFKYLVNFVGGIFFRAHLIHPRELPNTKKYLSARLWQVVARVEWGWIRFLDFERLRQERLRLFIRRGRN